MFRPEYERLTAKEKKCYEQLLERFSVFETEAVFNDCEIKTIENAFNAMLNDHPHIFWLSGGGEFVSATRNNVLQNITFKASLRNNITAATARAMYSTLMFQVNRIIEKAVKLKTSFEQVLFVHDYLVDNTDYDINASNCYDAYGCIVDRRAVCSGYTKAFQLIMCALGYDCGVVTGGTHEEINNHVCHMWNYIKLDGEYYYIDLTWDDPISLNSMAKKNKTHDYFCITTEELLKTHCVSESRFLPVCNSRKYDYYVYKGYYLDRYTFEGVERIAQKQLPVYGKFSVKFSSSVQTRSAMDDLFKNRRIYNIKGIGSRVSYSVNNAGLVLTVEA